MAAEFDRELASVFESEIFIDRDIYCIDGQVVVDEVIDHGNLWPCLREIGARLGKTVPEVAPNAKGRYRVDRRPATEILSDQQKSAVQSAMRFEFEMFGYAR